MGTVFGLKWPWFHSLCYFPCDLKQSVSSFHQQMFGKAGCLVCARPWADAEQVPSWVTAEPWFWKMGTIVSYRSIRRSKVVTICLAQSQRSINICCYYFIVVKGLEHKSSPESQSRGTWSQDGIRSSLHQEEKQAEVGEGQGERGSDRSLGSLRQWLPLSSPALARCTVGCVESFPLSTVAESWARAFLSSASFSVHATDVCQAPALCWLSVGYTTVTSKGENILGASAVQLQVNSR